MPPPEREAFGGRPGRPRLTGAAVAPAALAGRTARCRFEPAGRRRETSGGPSRIPNFEPTVSMTFLASSTGFFFSIAFAYAIAPGRSIPRRLRTSRMTPALIVLGFSLNTLPIASFTSRSVSALFFLTRSVTNVRIPARFLSIAKFLPRSNSLTKQSKRSMLGVPGCNDRMPLPCWKTFATSLSPTSRRPSPVRPSRPPSRASSAKEASRSPSSSAAAASRPATFSRTATQPTAPRSSRAITSRTGIPRRRRSRWRSRPRRPGASSRAAARMRERKHEFSATMVLEIGKSWPEADVETAEAIDFLEFYAREMLRWGGEIPVTPYPGEFPETRYLPLGAGAVIPPWNFPNAILTGMTVAAVVTGNSVVLKPASDTPLVAWKVFTLLEEAGVPDGVVNYLPGPGSDVGDFLVEAPETRFISFTGSKAVGLGIHEKAARVVRGQRWIKRTVLEMGGKDFIVVDEDADFDFAVSQVVASAFGFQGQKCSACSRAIVHKRLYKRFVDAVIARTAKLSVGPTRDGKNFMGPVASEKQFKTVTDFIKVGRRESKIGTGGVWHGRTGNFIQPTVFYDVKPSARIFREEIFGPVLGISEARDFHHAIELANASEYGLTGSYFGRDRMRIAEAKKRLHTGNLYINRKCTGALVGVHTFGGFDMSGTDSKAGGRDYLGLFLQAQSISERL